MALIKKVFINAAIKAGAHIREVAFHEFSPYGISGVVIISESHLTVHSFPEHAYASVDVYTCGTMVNPHVAIDYIRDALEAERCEIKEIRRGTKPIKI